MSGRGTTTTANAALAARRGVAPSSATRWDRARILSGVRAAAGPALAASFVALGVALLLGRVPLPGGGSFGYASLARNVVLLAIAGALLRAPGLALQRSTIGPALLLFVLVAGLSVAVNGGHWGSFRLLTTGLGIFYVARTLADGRRGAWWLFHWLGWLTIGILVREVSHQPAVLGLREAYRFSLVTDHANTLGFVGAVLAPVFLAATAHPDRRRAASLYFWCSALLIAISFSRAAWLALVLEVAAFVLVRGTRRALAGAAAAIVAATVTIATATGYLSLGRLEADLQRLRIIATSLSLFREHWLLGIGFGGRNLEQLFPERYLALYGESLFLFHSHNFYVDLLTGTGVIGAVTAAYLLATLAWVAWRAAGRVDGPPRDEAIGYAIALGAFLLLAVVDMPFYHGRLLLLLVIVWAMMESASRVRA